MTPDDSADAPSAGGTTAAAPIQTPPMVRPAEGAVGDLPVHSGPRRVLGVKAGARSGDFYFLASVGPWSRRYARRFALDEAGWAAAWGAFATEDPEGARQYLERRAAKQAAAAATAGASRSTLPPELGPTWDLSLGWSYILCGGVIVVVAVILLYAGETHDNAGLAIFSIIVFWLGVVLALIGVVAEGIRVSQQERDRSR